MTTQLEALIHSEKRYTIKNLTTGYKETTHLDFDQAITTAEELNMMFGEGTYDVAPIAEAGELVNHYGAIMRMKHLTLIANNG